MNESVYPKGQKICSPEGPGEVIEIIGDKVVVKLDNGETKTFPSDDIADDSSAG
jgi:myosin-like protein